MKRQIAFFFFLFAFIFLISCDKETSIPTSTDSSFVSTTQALSESEIYQLLINAEEMSGMKDYDGLIIRESGDLELPTSYQGVSISYSSRNPGIISDQGVVTLPDSCWIESRGQDGVTPFPNLNDNWPVVLDVMMEYMGQTRTAKLMFVVQPETGFTCDKYLGD